MAHLLGAESLHIEVPAGVVFDAVTLGVAEGDRIGIVGRNGSGKSTLLRALAGRREPDGGRVTLRRGTRIGTVDQVDGLDAATTVRQAVIGEAQDHTWARNPRIREVVGGLLGPTAGISLEATVGTLSGGQRRRVALAATLVGEHDLLLLDEPTNHLDLEAIAWLAGHLRGRWAPNAGGLVVVTHDRWFLDEVCTAMWEVHDRTVSSFEGGYAAYVLQRVERDRMAAATEAKRQNILRKELAWLRRGPPARTTKPKFRIDAANALIAAEPAPRDALSLHRMATSRLGRDVIDLLGVSVSYGDLPVLTGVEWRLAPGERTGILGINGAGKSTLLNVIAGTQAPTSGEVRRGKTVKVGRLTQEAAGLGDGGSELVRNVLKGTRSSYVSGGRELTPAQLLERLGFTNAHLSTAVRDLSGGQQRRLQFLLLLLGEPNVLLLDEPSNDLDTDMLAVIEDLLDTWPGTLIVVSHDRYFLERVTDQQYAVIGGRLRHLPGGVDEYLGLAEASAPAPAPRVSATRVPATRVPATPQARSSPAAAPASNPDRQARREEVAAVRAATKELAAVERRLAKLPAEIAEVNRRLAEHDPSDYAGLLPLLESLRSLTGQQSDLETRWLELHELIEASTRD